MLKARTVQIIKSLINSNNGIPLDILAKEFQISVRTLRNEISNANYFLAKHHYGYIKNIKNIGVVLEYNQYKQQDLLHYIEQINQSSFLLPEERYFDLILAIAFDTAPTYLYTKEVQYHVSKSTLDEDMRRIRQQLKYYQIEVISIPKQGLILKGSERSIRTMLFDLINNNIGILNYQSSGIDQSRYENILFTYLSKEAFKQIDLAYDYAISSKQDHYYRKYFLIFTAIWINRIQKNNLSIGFENKHTTWDKSEIINFIRQVLSRLSIIASSKEIRYLQFILQTLNPKNMNNSSEWIQAQLLTIQLIQFVEIDTNIPFSKRGEELYEGLYCHMAGLLNRMGNDLQVINPLKSSIKKNYQQIYQSIKKFVPTIEKVVKKRVTSDEITFLTIYFSTSESKINQNITQVYKAAVVCNHGSATAKLLAENLKERFNIDIVAILSSRELEILERLDVDIIFSTIKLGNPCKPCCVLQPIIRDIDKRKIDTFLAQNSHLQRQVNIHHDYTKLLISLLTVIEKNSGKVSQKTYQELVNTLETYDLKINKEEVQPMLKEVLKESDILFDLSAENWAESIQKVAVPLVQSHVIEPRYIDAMVNTVKHHGAYIVIDKYIALAHARPEDGVNKLGISVAKLKHPIPFGNDDNDPVKILFCLAAIDNYSHLNIMKNLVELINDKKRMTRLFQAKNKSDFQTILYS